MTSLIVGIDPGVSTGFSVWDAEAQQLMQVKTLCAAKAMQTVADMWHMGSLKMVVFEDARMRGGGKEQRFGAGSVCRDCSIWVEWLGLLGCPYMGVSPKAKGAKVSDKMFKAITGWQGRTSEHARDAAMLVFGRR